MRRILVADIPGLGPKQASMFLRNVGVTYDLAVLDTHVLHYMARQDLGSVSVGNISTFRAYELVEEGVVRYANSLGYRTGFVDRAIWVTMKAAGELGI
jgi:N-glycosylase/DNA lyase